MRGRCILVIGAATLAAVALARPSQAATLDPIAWSYSVTVCDCETAVTLTDDSTSSPSAPLPQSASANWPPPDLQNSVIGGNAAVTISNFPAVLVTTALSQNGDVPTGRATAYGEMSYQFEVSPIDGSVSGGILTVPVLFNGTYSGSISPTGGGIAGTGVQMSVSSTADNSVLYSLAGGSTPGAYGGSLDIIPGVIYSVFMAAQAEVRETTGGSGASIDPNFFIDPSLAGQFQIQFSPGIQNAVATTPLPAALPLFISALGGLGLVGWRRRKAAA